MSKRVPPSLHTLPIELIYRILDHLNEFSILLSARNVCVRLNAIIETYQPYQIFTILDLKHRSLNNDLFKCLIRSLQTNTTITTLELSGHHLNDEIARELGYVLQRNKTLTKLNCGENRISTEGLRFFIMGLKNNTVSDDEQQNCQLYCYLLSSVLDTLTLCLAWTSIHTEGARYLSNSLQNPTVLSHLFIGKCNIGNEGVRYLASVLKYNKTLIDLDVTLNEIDKMGVEYLADALSQNKVNRIFAF
ncbi:hypothetical protein I4U23_015266 [Adineta vaga]|nr:hypothetical protein I4U23_015266 [Adineta vaga]